MQFIVGIGAVLALCYEFMCKMARDNFVVYNRIFNLGLKMCVCERLCMLVSSFLKCELQCCGRDEHTQRNASVQPY